MSLLVLTGQEPNAIHPGQLPRPIARLLNEIGPRLSTEDTTVLFRYYGARETEGNYLIQGSLHYHTPGAFRVDSVEIAAKVQGGILLDDNFYLTDNQGNAEMRYRSYTPFNPPGGIDELAHHAIVSAGLMGGEGVDLGEIISSQHVNETRKWIPQQGSATNCNTRTIEITVDLETPILRAESLHPGRTVTNQYNSLVAVFQSNVHREIVRLTRIIGLNPGGMIVPWKGI